MSILSETFNGFVYFYYVDFMGLAMVSAALVRTVYSIWDAIDDPLMGFLSDHTRSRWGRRRPWFIFSLPLFLLIFVLVFSVPAAFQTPSRLFVYMLIVLFIYETVYTIVNVNFSALYVELFQALFERARSAMFIQSGNLLGLLVGLTLSPLLFKALGFSTMAIIYAVATGTLFLFYLYYNREGLAATARQWSDLLPVLRGILIDRAFWLYFVMMALAFLSIGLVPFSLPFYVKYTLNAPTSTISLISGIGLIVSLATMPLWPKLIKAWGLRTVFLVAIAISGSGLLGFGIFTALPGVVLSGIIIGVTSQGINVCNLVIRALLISRNISRTSLQNEAAYYGMINSALRLGGLLQSLSMLLVGALFGYVSGEIPGPNPGAAFRFLISVLPILSLVLAFVFAWLFFKASGLKANAIPAS